MNIVRVNVEFNVRLKTAMKLRKLNQLELSDLCGIRRESISHYLSGKFLPKVEIFLAMAKALNVDPMWLIGDTGTMGSNCDSYDNLLYLYQTLTDEDKTNLHNYAVNVLLQSPKYKEIEKSKFKFEVKADDDSRILVDSFILLDNLDKSNVIRYIQEFLLTSPKYQNKKETSA